MELENVNNQVVPVLYLNPDYDHSKKSVDFFGWEYKEATDTYTTIYQNLDITFIKLNKVKHTELKLKLDENLEYLVEDEILNINGESQEPEPKIFTAQFSEFEISAGREEPTPFSFEKLKDSLKFKYKIGTGGQKILTHLEIEDYKIPNQILLSEASNTLPVVTDENAKWWRENRFSYIAKILGQVGTTAALFTMLGPVGGAAGAAGLGSLMSQVAGAKSVVNNLNPLEKGRAFQKAAMLAEAGEESGSYQQLDYALKTADVKKAGQGVGLIQTNIARTISSLATDIGTMADRKAKPMKYQAGSDSIDYNLNNDYLGYMVLIKIPTQKEKDRLNQFFHKFGYSVNKMGIPNLDSRETFNFIQTNYVAIKGAIPRNYKQEIEDIFNNGVRFWHKSDKFLDFTATNDEVVGDN